MLRYLTRLAAALFVLSLATLSSGLAAADGNVGWDSVRSYLRTETSRYNVWQNDTAANGTEVGSVGVAGVIMSAALNSQTGVTWTSSIGAVPHACKLELVVKDSDNDTTASCTSGVAISGVDTFGYVRNERLGTLNETALKSRYVYEKVTRIAFNLCTGADSGDTARVACSMEVGLPLPVRSKAAVLQVCAIDTSASLAQYCWSGAAVDENITIIDPSTGLASIDLAGVGASDSPGQNFTWGDGDLAVVRMRAGDGVR